MRRDSWPVGNPPRSSAVLETADRCGVFAFCEVESIGENAPHVAPEGGALLLDDYVHRMADAACFAQDGAVKGKLVNVAVALDVRFKPGQIVAGFEVDNSERFTGVSSH